MNFAAKTAVKMPAKSIFDLLVLAYLGKVSQAVAVAQW
jgi:hypothetical protein